MMLLPEGSNDALRGQARATRFRCLKHAVVHSASTSQFARWHGSTAFVACIGIDTLDVVIRRREGYRTAKTWPLIGGSVACIELNPRRSGKWIE
jgi:hypothetical protein